MVATWPDPRTPRHEVVAECRREYAATDAHYREYAKYAMCEHVKKGGRIDLARPLLDVLLAKIDRAAEEYDRSCWLYGSDRSDAPPQLPITYPFWMHEDLDSFVADLGRLRA